MRRGPAGPGGAWVVTGYFDPAGWVDRWRFVDAAPDAPEFAVRRFDRTLAEYVNGVLGAGFALTGIEEPRPSEDYCRAHPSQRGWRDHAALFLYLRAEKPGSPDRPSGAGSPGAPGAPGSR